MHSGEAKGVSLRDVSQPGGGDPSPDEGMRRTRDVIALAVILTGGAGFVISVFFIHPLMLVAVLCLATVWLGVLIGMD
jgi:hypothetical protein